MIQILLLVVSLQISCFYCAPINLIPQIQPWMQWSLLQQPVVSVQPVQFEQNVQMEQIPQQNPQLRLLPQMHEMPYKGPVPLINPLIASTAQINQMPQKSPVVSLNAQMGSMPIPQTNDMLHKGPIPQFKPVINQMPQRGPVQQINPQMEFIPQANQMPQRSPAPQMMQIPQINTLEAPGEHNMLEAEELALQEQILALQQWQALQNMNAMHGPIPMALPPPLLVIMANAQQTEKQNDFSKSAKENDKENQTKHDTEQIDETLDSITIENADDEYSEKGEDLVNAILLLPQPRISIGSIISSIPWLPFEVNVPDTIAWGYNGISNWISGIISIIGQRFPLRRPQANLAVVNPTNANETKLQNVNVKSFLKQLQRKEDPMMPILVVPLGGTLRPFQIVN